VHFPAKQMWLDYDPEADVLILSFRRPQHVASGFSRFARSLDPS
jgi:hypothetical protein